MKPIFLMGYMGCGKSTLGRALGRETSLTFIDLDIYIESRFRANIRTIFAERGEAAFRELERRMLDEVSQFEDVIVACGGGTPCFGDNMDLMLERGETVFLEASRSRLLERLKLGRARRPLIANLDDEALARQIDAGLEQRLPHYTRAVHTFNSDRLDNAEQIRETVDKFIQRFNLPRK
ncbi:MAG: shikimate kinase [Muribaculaceae bacterium]|nr:shikimate kinase [Muribaculaceae bacterium]